MEQKKYLVGIKWIVNNFEPIVICDTKEKAQEYIDKEMNDNHYIGTGYYKIIELPFIN